MNDCAGGRVMGPVVRRSHIEGAVWAKTKGGKCVTV